MTTQSASTGPSLPPPYGKTSAFFFNELHGRPICIGSVRNRIGKVSDLVFRVTETYPEAMGIVIDHGWGKSSEMIPWSNVQRIEDDSIFVSPPEPPDPTTSQYGAGFPPFVDQPGWILLDQHLEGKTIFDMDGRRTEVVNDVHLLASHGRMVIIHVDLSFNGFLRKWGLSRWIHVKDQLVSWKYVQPFSLEDALAKDAVSLSITRRQMKELPPEDLADTLEELTGPEQQALFSALEPETAAEALAEAEPRTQRQLIADLRQERARKILSELSVPQLADLMSVLPHEDSQKMMGLLPNDSVERIKFLLSEREATADSMINGEYVAMPKEARVGDVLTTIRSSGLSHDAISYVYVIEPSNRLLLGVVDLRELVLSPAYKSLGDLMDSPAVAAEADDTRDDLAELFAKYHFRMIPVVNKLDHLLGVIHYNDIMRGVVARRD